MIFETNIRKCPISRRAFFIVSYQSRLFIVSPPFFTPSYSWMLSCIRKGVQQLETALQNLFYHIFCFNRIYKICVPIVYPFYVYNEFFILRTKLKSTVFTVFFFNSAHLQGEGQKFERFASGGWRAFA